MVFQKKMALSGKKAGFVPGPSGGNMDRDGKRVNHLWPKCGMLVFHHQRELVTQRLVFRCCAEHCKDPASPYRYEISWFLCHFSYQITLFSPLRNPQQQKNELTRREEKAKFPKQLLQKFFSYGGLRIFFFSFCLIRF